MKSLPFTKQEKKTGESGFSFFTSCTLNKVQKRFFSPGPTPPIVSGLSQGNGEYFTGIGIGVGSPPKYLYMVLDTGSDVVWLQCAPCKRCYSQTDPVFDRENPPPSPPSLAPPLSAATSTHPAAAHYSQGYIGHIMSMLQMSSGIKAKVSYQQAYRTKIDALNQLELCMKEQYAKVQDYAQELRRTDPNTMVDIMCDFNNLEKQPIFKRMYICLGALKEGFKNGCRPILGLDGCHLKSPYGGQLLCAVGLDANNTTYVVAYAMVEMESKDSWIWFLSLLEKDLKITGEGNGFTFISDK
ncbi:hypothetical protein ACLB2K_075087 [Fragaria x ananassa]